MNYLQLPTQYAAYDLTALQLWIIADLVTMEASGLTYYRSNTQIAERFGRDRVTVIRAIRKLEAFGLVQCTQEPGRRIMRLCTSGANATGGVDASSTNATPLVAPTPPPGSVDATPPSGVDATLVEKVSREVRKEVSRKGTGSKKTEVVLPWDTDTFREVWDTWKAERRERRTKAYTARGEQAALHELYTMAAEDEATAAAIVKQSITKGWQGLFPLKNGKNGKQQLTADEQADNRRKLANYVKYGTFTPNGV